MYCVYLLSSEASWAVAGLVVTSLGQAVSLSWPQVTIGPLQSEKHEPDNEEDLMERMLEGLCKFV